MATGFFSKVRAGGEGVGDLSAGPVSRVNKNPLTRAGHSARDYAKDFHTTYGLGRGTNSAIGGKDGASGKAVLNKVVDVATNTAGVVGALAGGAAIALDVAAVSTAVAAGIGAVAFAGAGAAIAAIGGPITAVVVGVVGIAIMIRSAYSNRDAAHNALEEHCWSLIDDSSPKTPISSPDTLFKASSASMELLDDGKSQVKLLGLKLQSAATELQKLNTKLAANESKIANATTHLQVMQLSAENKRLIEDGMKRGGAIWLFARRARHTGNYLQAPAIIALAMKHRFEPATPLVFPDYFASMEMGPKLREIFSFLDDFYSGCLERVDRNTVNARKSQAATNVANAGKDQVRKTPRDAGIYKRT